MHIRDIYTQIILWFDLCIVYILYSTKVQYHWQHLSFHPLFLGADFRKSCLFAHILLILIETRRAFQVLMLYLELFLGRSTAWMLGRTPPDAMVTPPKSLFNSSSFFTARVICLGTIRDFLLSRAAFPASSRISAQRYSSTAARYTGAPAPIRVAYFPWRR